MLDFDPDHPDPRDYDPEARAAADAIDAWERDLAAADAPETRT